MHRNLSYDLTDAVSASSPQKRKAADALAVAKKEDGDPYDDDEAKVCPCSTAFAGHTLKLLASVRCAAAR
jgi:hypothetical protein